jgi:hypothetical protein
MVSGAVWVVVYRQRPAVERADSEKVTPIEEQAAVAVSPTPPEMIGPTKDSTPLAATAVNNATPNETPDQRVPLTPRLASFLLLPGSVRGSEDVQLLSIPARAQSVRLRLSLEGQPATGSVRAELRRLSADGELVWRTGVVRAQRSSLGPVVSVELPANKLPAGKYSALIKGADAAGRIETVYSFSVTRK